MASSHPRFSEFARRHGLTLIVRESAKNELAFDFFARRFRGASPLLSSSQPQLEAGTRPCHSHGLGINE